MARAFGVPALGLEPPNPAQGRKLAAYASTWHALDAPVAPHQKTPEARATLSQQIPLERLGTPADIAGVVTFLASDYASYITGQVVVVDLRSPYVCMGTFVRCDDRSLELIDADLHDLRDTATSRENYIAASVRTGIKRNRKRLIVNRSGIVAVSKLEDFVDV